MHFNIAIKNYLTWKSSYALTAADRYKVRLSHFCDYLRAKGISEISKIDGNTLNRYLNEMEKEFGYSRATVAYSARIIKNFFEFIKGRGIPCLNPKEIRPARFISPDKDFVTEEDLEQMSDILDEQYFDDLTRKLIIHLLWDTGIRVSELADLNISDIEETKIPGIRCARIRRRKTLRHNIVAWGSETNRLLNLYLGLRLNLDKPTDALFVTNKTSGGLRLTTRTIERWIVQLSRESMLGKNITPHSFRHGKAHYVLDKSGNVKHVQELLGHANPASSFHYLAINESQYLNVASHYLKPLPN